jgi:hypothetical protein
MGLGVHRHGDPIAVALSATVLVFVPALMASAFTTKNKTLTFSSILASWSLGLLLMMPLYFPGERSEALEAGLAIVLDRTDYAHMPKIISQYLPKEPPLSQPQLQLASAIVVPKPPPRHQLEDNSDAISLAYEGEGSRLSIPVVFEHEGKTLEVEMMLDTGATYTTLPPYILKQLHLTPSASAPVLELHTANGIRNAQVVLLDKVWLGDLFLEGVAITMCDDCASDKTAGLLGLNISGSYNVSIDADRQEVAFSRRHNTNRRLDMKPFTELDASFTRYPGGRIEVDVSLQNDSPRAISEVQALILCDQEQWLMPIQNIGPYKSKNIRRRLPEHPPCESYQVSLEQAHW